MRLTPTTPDIPWIGGFTAENDIFGYQEFGQRLARLVQTVDEPLVIALDGAWGSGKSTFVKQWAGLVREQGAPTIYFDAFGNDHYEDAFLPISAEILLSAQENIRGSNKDLINRYIDQAKKVGSVLTPMGLQILARAGTAGLLSFGDIKDAGAAVETLITAAGDESAKLVQKVISERIQAVSDEKATLEAFRLTLSELARSLSEKQTHDEKKWPLIFIIDEVDRCRPPFALNLIERVKHLFTVQNVCFLVVTDLNNIAKAVSGAYGSDFDGRGYLEKFYQLRITLPSRDEPVGPTRKSYIHFLVENLDIEVKDPRTTQLLVKEIQRISDSHNLTLRKIERIITHVALVNSAINKNHLIISPIISGLCVLRHLNPDLYQRLAKQKTSFKEIFCFLMNLPSGHQPHLDQKIISADWSYSWWAYALNGPLTEEKKRDFGNALAAYSISAETIIPHMCSYIDDFYQDQI